MNNNQTYYRGKFVGLFKRQNVKAHGELSIAGFKWNYLKITDVTKTTGLDYFNLKTGDYWYSPFIRNRKRFNFSQSTDILILGNESKFYSGDLFHVVIRGIEITKHQSNHSISEWTEAIGDIYFYLEHPKKDKAVNPKKSNEKVNAINISTLAANETIKTASIADPLVINDTPNTIRPTIANKSPFGFTKILSWLLILFVLTTTWLNGSIFFYIILGLSILHLLNKFIKISWLRNLITFLLFAVLVFYLISVFSSNRTDNKRVETKDGNIKVSPPKENKDTEGRNDKDFLNDKEINWYDFVNNHYRLKYATSSLTFFDSKNKHTQISESISANSPMDYYTNLYQKLLVLDHDKITAVVDSMSFVAKERNLNAQQLAEMVVTFVQEIPYYLVHEGTCQQSMSNDRNGFVTGYHRQQKPCLPNVAGGVQSPYEFLHNLKGDCDTRSLLAFSILKRLGITSSVWVSEVYGHSILGVGVPVGYGIHKNIRGIEHFGVELTAKGYRIGMVSPDNNNKSNWDITVFYNNN